MEVTLLYYDIIFEENDQVNLFNNKKTDIKDKITKFKKKNKLKNILYKENNYIISVIEIEPTFIFGTYGRLEDVSEKRLTGLRSKKNLEEVKTEKIKDYIENYTVFYYDIAKNICIALHNPNIYGFENKFSNFLMNYFNLSYIYKNISVLSRIDENMSQKIGQLERIKKVTYKYSSNKMPENEFLTINEVKAFEDHQIKSANVELYLEVDSNFDKTVDLLSDTESYIDKFDTFKIHTEDLILDVVDKALSKKVNITLEEEELEDVNILKEILVENLNKY